VNFGALRVGQTSQRNLKLVNRSPAPITFTLAITPAVVALQQANILSINPSTEITLRANGGSFGVELTFKPKSRIPHFTEEVRTLLWIDKSWNFSLTNKPQTRESAVQ